MDKNKKTKLILIGILEVAILIFSLTISIIVSSTIHDNKSTNMEKNGPFIATLQNNPVLFFCTILLPVLLIFLGDAAYLIVYLNKKASLLNDNEKKAIEEEAKRQAREEVLKEMQSEQKEDAEKPADPKPEEPKK